jgi:hypothetical protein
VGSVCVRLRFCEPVPQDSVLEDQGPLPFLLLSAAHACSLQARVSS